MAVGTSFADFLERDGTGMQGCDGEMFEIQIGKPANGFRMVWKGDHRDLRHVGA